MDLDFEAALLIDSGVDAINELVDLQKLALLLDLEDFDVLREVLLELLKLPAEKGI